MSTLIHPQLPLGFEPGELFTFESFIAGNNAVAVGLAQQLSLSQGETQLYFWGEAGLGKSHLLQACCNFAAKSQQAACYLTPAEITLQTPDMFEGLEQLPLLCLDDIDHWLKGPSWETALFNLINRFRETGNRLILTSSSPPDDGFVELPDLQSRLAWGPVFQIQELSDKDKYRALRYRANQNGLELPENVAEYLMQRYPRDMFGLVERLAELDKAAMATKRRLTIPLVKSVFER